ncbi:MAG: thioredoxin [Ruminococcaceae bacterium]|nr:thioredoxin [Oscillospiraceae bacterium]
MAEIIVTNENYIDEVINSDIPVLLDFWATWCGPCRMIAPIVEEIAAENVGKIKVGKVNVDEQEELAVMFSISAIPTLVVIKDGEVVNKIVGIKPKEDILKLFE